MLILGAGTIGLAALLLARHEGARVASLDIVPEKLAIAAGLGADLTINPAGTDPQMALRDWTNGDGPSVVIEAVGSPGTTRSALDYVSPAGRVVIVGITTADVPFPIPLVVRKEMDIIASRNSREQFRRVVPLVEAGLIDPRPLVSHRLPLEDLESAFELIRTEPGSVRKVLTHLRRLGRRAATARGDVRLPGRGAARLRLAGRPSRASDCGRANPIGRRPGLVPTEAAHELGDGLDGVERDHAVAGKASRRRRCRPSCARSARGRSRTGSPAAARRWA